ncbi:hypothetical protein RRG08_019428 [Elysia crispata]|uniref:Uncharacterized protein n=1 Tax=Elysia crispata TaxID=231223 RepID=A0AAE0Z3B4_9GAST|nr:hypothetical protein RRG08_019428 [Elysia crispata]
MSAQISKSFSAKDVQSGLPIISLELMECVKQSRPVPQTSTKHYGWNIGPGTNRLEYLDSLTKPPARQTINQQLNWPWGSQD